MKVTSYGKVTAAAAGIVFLAFMMLAAGPLGAQTAISADGVVESMAGGFKFPDGSVQTRAALGGAAPVEDTGQDKCYDETGTTGDEIACAGTGQDGESQVGVAFPTARFTDNGDGTVTDNLTGLIWLKDANCPGIKTLQDALAWVVLFNTTSIACADYAAMTFTDWRLPNIKELFSLTDLGEGNPALSLGHPFQNALVFPSGSDYWSSTSPISFATSGYVLTLDFGSASVWGKTNSAGVWPVRGGH